MIDFILYNRFKQRKIMEKQNKDRKRRNKDPPSSPEKSSKVKKTEIASILKNKQGIYFFCFVSKNCNYPSI